MNDSGNINCSFYNETMCSNGGCVSHVVTGRYCYSLWSNVTNDESITTNLTTTTNRAVSQVKIKQRGCLTGHNYDCANSTKCIASRYTKGHYFCCCKEDFCNEEVYLLSNISEHSPHQAKTSQIHGSDSNWSYALIASLASIVLIFIILYYIWFKRRKKRFGSCKRYSEAGERILITNQMNGINSCTTNDTISLTRNHGGGGGDHLHHNGSNPPTGYRIELIEELSTGRFGCVWKAKMFNCKKELLVPLGGSICYDIEDKETHADDSLIPSTITTSNVDSDGKDSLNYKIVAVKIFPPHEKSSWISEQQVFKTPQIEHENILRFLGSEKRDDPNNVPLSPSGFWLITEYHELGSLCDYLKKNTVNIDQLVKISIGIAAGLNHLHYEIPEGDGSGKGDNQTNMKASIVHRDFKSRNVLLKSDLTPRIADFGLALIFYPSRTPAELGQVGTRRYMAPEVLEGAISYTQDSLYRIDIYACALVLWEIVSRCHGSDKIKTADGDEENISVFEYKLPFEQEVGLNPSLEDMQETVCQAKKRPILQQQWLNHPILKMICQTIEECWDQDAEARLSASCILERLTILAKNRI